LEGHQDKTANLLLPDDIRTLVGQLYPMYMAELQSFMQPAASVTLGSLRTSVSAKNPQFYRPVRRNSQPKAVVGAMTFNHRSQAESDVSFPGFRARNPAREVQLIALRGVRPEGQPMRTKTTDNGKTFYLGQSFD
jgi:hypothetical protein